MSQTEDCPTWFRDALAMPRDERVVEVDGCPIHYLRWGDPAAPGLVLVHGGAAHAHWWSFLAPMLAGRYHVVALDLSGHGDSGWRPTYEFERWAAEVVAVADHAGMRDRLLLVGHSMGGVVTAVAASLHGERLAGAVIVDSPVGEPDPERTEAEQGRAFRPDQKIYPDVETALPRFRLVPDQPPPPGYVIDHVARHSLRPVEGGGWTWKFDPRIFAERSPYVLHDYLPSIRCRLAVFSGEHSDLVTSEVSSTISELVGDTAPFVEIPAAHHHLLLDQPLALIAALRAILADWEYSLPRCAPANSG